MIAGKEKLNVGLHACDPLSHFLPRAHKCQSLDSFHLHCMVLECSDLHSYSNITLKCLSVGNCVFYGLSIVFVSYTH